jgi:hypothetical protein
VSKPYRRRSGVIWRPGNLGVPRAPRFGWFWFGGWSNDGGEDVPLSSRGRAIYRSVVGVLVFGIVCLLAYAVVR